MSYCLMSVHSVLKRGISSACDNRGFIISDERAGERARWWNYALKGVREPRARAQSVALQLYRVTMHRNGGFARLPRSFLVSILVAAAAAAAAAAARRSHRRPWNNCDDVARSGDDDPESPPPLRRSAARRPQQQQSLYSNVIIH